MADLTGEFEPTLAGKGSAKPDANSGEFGDLLRDAHRAVNELDRLRAENERLREALSKVDYLGSQAQSNAAVHMGMVARAALSGGDERG